MDAYIWGYFIGAIIWGIIWGFAAKAVVTNKGYEEEGKKYFWLGFFFSFIPLIVAATKQNRNSTTTINRSVGNAYEDLEKIAKLKQQGAITEDEFNKLKADCLKRM